MVPEAWAVLRTWPALSTLTLLVIAVPSASEVVFCTVPVTSRVTTSSMPVDWVAPRSKMTEPLLTTPVAPGLAAMMPEPTWVMVALVRLKLLGRLSTIIRSELEPSISVASTWNVAVSPCTRFGSATGTVSDVSLPLISALLIVGPAIST